MAARTSPRSGDSRFLFPVDSGGKIRTTQVLRGLMEGTFKVTLASPAPTGARERFARELGEVCHRFVEWRAPKRGTLFRIGRLRWLASRLPISVVADRSAEGVAVVERLLVERPAVLVVDFPHAAMVLPGRLEVPSVLFTHNVEAEIFARHAQVERRRLLAWLWRIQHRRMVAFEGATLQRFDSIIAVSRRDADAFQRDYGCANTSVIDTGVDLDYFGYHEPPASDQCVFMGSMDWLANIDGVEFFMDEVWPRIVERRPRARMVVVGRTPPASLVQRATSRGLAWKFTGFVEDVRPYVRESTVFVIPLRVAGGTRLKAFEAMALGCPVVSTGTGVEGLRVEDGRHYLRGDSAAEMAARVIELLEDHERAVGLARSARAHVEESFSFRNMAREFERICLEAARSTARA
jgi:glycosyltransferase involved in cell wall biosynthesis